MGTIGMDIVSRSTVATGKARHRAFNGTVRLTSGEILIFYREGSDHWVTDDGVVKMVRSSDDGESWSDPETVFSDPEMSCGAHHAPAAVVRRQAHRPPDSDQGYFPETIRGALQV